MAIRNAPVIDPEQPRRSAFRALLSEAPLLAVVATAVVVYTIGGGWFGDLDNPLAVAGLLVWIFAAMLWASFGAVRHADSLAELLGEPYGTLILTISVTIIEVSVIAAMMLNADPDPELARDTMFAVVMIVLNLVVGLGLLIGGLRHGEQSFNLQGASAFLGVLVPLAVISLILPRFTSSGSGAGLTVLEAAIFCGVSVVLYATFLAIQTGRHRQYFTEPGGEDASSATGGEDAGSATGGVMPVAHKPPGSVGYHAALLVMTLVPIVLLAEKLAILVDHGIEVTGAPPPLGGMMIATLVLAPEAFAALEAAYRNHLQRAVNVCLGSALATIGLTVPVVLAVGLVADLHVMLGVADDKIVLLALTLFMASLTFGGSRTNVLQGMVHVALFVVYLILIFD